MDRALWIWVSLRGPCREGAREATREGVRRARRLGTRDDAFGEKKNLHYSIY